MPSDMYKSMQGQKPMTFMDALNQLKAKGGDPNQMIQEMLSNGKVSQAQYNAAVQWVQQRAPQIQQLLTSVRR